MNSLIIPALLALIKADFAGDASAVIKTASILSSLVAGWDKGVGLSGALAIQETYDPLSSAVAALDSSAGSAEVNDANMEALASLASGISGLLDALTSKAEDFASVGASQIVQGDIDHLSDPSGSIVSQVYAKGKSNCEAISKLAGPLETMSSAFDKAASAFSAKAPTFPNLVCEGGSSESSSTEASSVKASSEATTTEASSSSEPTAVAESPSAVSTGVVAANGAVATGISFIAAAAALLL